MAEAGDLNMLWMSGLRLGGWACKKIMMMYIWFVAKWANESTSFNQTQLIKLTYDINPSFHACIIYINWFAAFKLTNRVGCCQPKDWGDVISITLM